MEKIGPYTYEQYCRRVKEFHGALAPGILVGGFMVDLACRNMPSGTLFDVISETVECLPDAVQLLTPCSVGNQWLKVIDVGRFAVTLYDKDTGEGVRVHLDTDKLHRWPAISEWFLKTRPKEQQDRARLLVQIREAGASIATIAQVTVSPDFIMGQTAKTVVVCPICNEAYRSGDGAICPACGGGRLPYVAQAERTSGNLVPARVQES